MYLSGEEPTDQAGGGSRAASMAADDLRSGTKEKYPVLVHI